MSYVNKGTLTTDKRKVNESTNWETTDEWEDNQSIDGIIIEDGVLKLDEASIAESLADSYWPMDDDGGSTVTDTVSDRDLDTELCTLNGDYVELEDVNDSKIESGDSFFESWEDFTIFGWYRNENADPFSRSLASASKGSDETAWKIDLDEGEYTVGTRKDGDLTEETYTQSFSADTWYSFALVRDSSNGEIEVYHDASSIGTNTLDTGELTSELGFYIASKDIGNSLEGDVQEYLLAKEKLSGSEIQDIHDETDPT